MGRVEAQAARVQAENERLRGELAADRARKDAAPLVCPQHADPGRRALCSHFLSCRTGPT